MSENTETAGQQPNSGEAAGDVTGTANPNAQAGTDPTVAPGQGEGGDKTGGDAGKQGDAVKDGAKDGEGQPEAVELTGAPEAYGDFALPEGFQLDGERKDLALALFRDSNLSQAGAQKYIDAFTKLVGEDAAMQQQAMEAAVAQQREEWGKAAKAELGANYDAEVAYARTAVQATQNPKLVQAFDELGWGNHPELIKTFAFFGKMMRDSPVDGIGSGGAATTPKKPWDVVYPDMNK